MARIMGVLSGALLAGWMVVTPTGPATAAPAPAASPLIAIVDGVIGGTLNFTGTGKQKWTFKFISSSRGGKLTLGTATTGQPVSDQSFTILPYASWLDGVPSRGHETFVVRATPAEKSAAAKPIDIEISVDLDAMAPGDTPVAFTYNVVGYAGTRISTNFFPASGLAAGQTGPLVLQAPGLGAPGKIGRAHV